jgi:hypothetical protein
MMEFDEKAVQAVWEKGRTLNNTDSTEWRKDECGAWIKRNQYGNQASEFGWKIEPIAPGNPQTPENLRPYQHENTFNTASGQQQCRVTADREGVPPTASIDKPRNKPAG